MIHTRSQLLDWIKQHVNDRVLKLAIERGSVEVLGGFEPLPTSANPGWLVQVTSSYGHTYLIAVASDPTTYGEYWFQAPRVPWANWIGHKSTNPLYQGDHPKLYAGMKIAWEGHDPRFTRIAGCPGLYTQADGSTGEPGEGGPVDEGGRDRMVPPVSQRQEEVHNRKARR